MVNAAPTVFGQAALTTPLSPGHDSGDQHLAFFNVRNAEVQSDRRVARRYVVDCPARLATSGGGRDGRLSDLSQHGARLETAQPLPPGTAGFLQWNGEDQYCTVIWVGEGRCGLQFERPIELSVVEATCRVEVSLRTVAAVGRIPLGQRRSGRIAAAE